MAVWDREDNIAEASKQLNDESIYKSVKFKFKHQILGKVIGTKFAPSYAWIFMDEKETKFLQTQEFSGVQID